MNIGTITNSNLCVVGKTNILTDKGYMEIGKLAGSYVNIWNGEVFSESLVMKTGENQMIIKVIFSDGSEIECTEYHKFYLEDGYIICAKDLRKDMKLMKFNLPTHDYVNATFNRIDKVNSLNNIINDFGSNWYSIVV